MCTGCGCNGILTTSTSTTETWTTWAGTTDSSTATITPGDNTWIEWNGNVTIIAQVAYVPVNPPARIKEQEAAVKKAEKLLKQHLNKDQLKTWKKSQYFDLKVGNRVYQIKRGWAGNVDLLTKEGKAKIKYCIHPNTAMPIEDSLLAQKLLLENDEKQFLSIANASRM